MSRSFLLDLTPARARILVRYAEATKGLSVHESVRDLAKTGLITEEQWQSYPGFTPLDRHLVQMMVDMDLRFVLITQASFSKWFEAALRLSGSPRVICTPNRPKVFTQLGAETVHVDTINLLTERKSCLLLEAQTTDTPTITSLARIIHRVMVVFNTYTHNPHLADNAILTGTKMLDHTGTCGEVSIGRGSKKFKKRAIPSFLMNVISYDVEVEYVKNSNMDDPSVSLGDEDMHTQNY